MKRAMAVITFLLLSVALWAVDKKNPTYPSFDYDAAQAHELKPHRRAIPIPGVQSGLNELRIVLTVSPLGDVVDAEAQGDEGILKYWPQLQDEVRQWKFTPFENDGKAVTAEVEEYVALVAPERLPQKHLSAPALRPNSKVEITLRRTGCLGPCPVYTVTVSTEGIVFDGRFNVVAPGKHADQVSADEVREFAKKFITADFYSMDAEYSENATDAATYVLSISIDGNKKEVVDYLGADIGMPAVITKLEDTVDDFAQTERWIKGKNGLVPALQAEGYNFQSFEAQILLKETASRGEADTVRALLQAGVLLVPFPATEPKEPNEDNPFAHMGWLATARGHYEVLQVLLGAAASKDDQNDKDLALDNAASSGNLEAVRALIAYGANPNVDLSKLTVTVNFNGSTLAMQDSGDILISAASSGNPEIVREFLSYHPDLEVRNSEGKTAIFAAGESGGAKDEAARAECVRLLVEAGANVNARDKDGNTPLHETFLTDVEKELVRLGADVNAHNNNGNTPLHVVFVTDAEEELLKLGADVNARNNNGETPIFTNADHDAILLFIKHGADLNIRNNEGKTIMEVAGQGSYRQELLRKAIQEFANRQ